MTLAVDAAVAPTPVAPAASDGPVARVVLGSMLAGPVMAALLSLVVFAGGSEATITGAALLGFASGWAALAVLSSRCTRRPQPWARVPAVALALTGGALLVLQPAEGSLTTASWIWPPLVLIGVGWTTSRVRTSLSGRTRWLVYPALVATAAAGLGGLAQSVAAVNDTTPAMPGRLYDIGGRSLHLHCTGTGGPTVVLQSGMGGMSSSWARVQPAVAASTRVCAYDRASAGWSDDAPHPQDANEVADDLHRLLAAAHEDGPFVVAGHSTGGTFALTFAARYPEQVAGLVLLDSSSPHQFDLPGFATTASMMGRGLAVLPSLTRLGIGRLVPAGALTALPDPAAEQLRAFGTSTRGVRSLRDEQAALREVFRQARALTTFGDRPLVVVTATEGQLPGWGGAQDSLARLSTNSSQRSVEAAHSELLEDVDAAHESVRAIDDVVTAARTHSSVTS